MIRWGRRKEAGGRHALGAAVTGIPTAPTRPATVPILADQPWSERYATTAFSPVQPTPVQPAPMQRVPVQAAPVQAAPVREAPPLQADPTGPRVELGFADGTFRMLDPSSSDALALCELVAELTCRDERPGTTAS
jgi:hypothetical protein